MKNARLFQLMILICVVLSCERQDNNTNNLSLDKISGYVQKGPYINGSSITLSELSSDLTQTGKNYSAQILDNKGTFEIKSIELVSRFAALKVDGFFYNEISNNNSTAPLTLYALSDLKDKSSLNVNVLSSLEKRRVEYLVSQGSAFNDAKSQAQSEILGIFEISKSDMKESENLDITQPGDDHAILLAISVILQGYLQVADLSELLANLSNDIFEDGELNDSTLGTSLINNAKTINLSEIRTNLTDRYESLGLDVTIPEFEKYVVQFIDNSDFEFTNFIKYPSAINNLTNLLSESVTEIDAGPMYCIGAALPWGTSLRVILKPSPGYHCNGNGIVANYGWIRNTTSCDSTNLEAFGEDQIVYIEYITGPISLDFFLYENGSITPTITKTITAN